MNEAPPNCPSDFTYCVKVTCALIGISKTSLTEYRRRGWITPTNPNNKFRPKYSGQSINELYEKLKTS